MFDQKSLKYPKKIKKLIAKSQKLTTKINNYVPILNLKHIQLKLFLQKIKLQAKNLGHLDEKTAKNDYLYASERIVLPVKKNLKKTNTPLRV